MSVVHHGMPESAMFSPARTWTASDSQVAGMSPDQTAVPYFCEPAQAERENSTVWGSPSVAIPSANSRALSRG